MLNSTLNYFFYLVGNYYDLLCIIPFIFLLLGYSNLFLISILIIIFGFLSSCLITIIYINIYFNNTNYSDQETFLNNYYINDILKSDIIEYDCDCPICLEKIKDNNAFYICENKHYFHNVCIKKWLIRSNKCPICRQ